MNCQSGNFSIYTLVGSFGTSLSLSFDIDYDM